MPSLCIFLWIRNIYLGFLPCTTDSRNNSEKYGMRFLDQGNFIQNLIIYSDNFLVVRKMYLTNWQTKAARVRRNHLSCALRAQKIRILVINLESRMVSENRIVLCINRSWNICPRYLIFSNSHHNSFAWLFRKYSCNRRLVPPQRI